MQTHVAEKYVPEQTFPIPQSRALLKRQGTKIIKNISIITKLNTRLKNECSNYAITNDQKCLLRS